MGAGLDTELAVLMQWVDRVLARAPRPELELLWLVGSDSGSAEDAAVSRFESYQAALAARFGAPVEVRPHPLVFEKYVHAFDALSAWPVANRELFLSVTSSEHEPAVYVGTCTE